MKLRLAIITEIIAPYRVPVFNQLARHDEIDLHVIFLSETDPTQYQWLVHKDEIEFSYEVLPAWRKRIGSQSLLLNWTVSETLHRVSPDVILCGGYNYIASWQSLRWAKRNRVPFFLWVESTASNFRSGSALLETLKSRFVDRCDGFLVPGRAAYDYVKSYGVAEQAIFTAPNAVDTDFFSRHAAIARKNANENRQKLGLPERFFLFVGRLVPEKGIFDLLEAYSTLSKAVRDEVGLVLVGDGEAKSALARRARALKSGNIKIAGFAQREDLASYYGLAEILVFPTHTDAWGLVINEAISCGLPVICSSAAGCVSDLVEEHVNGRVVPPREINRLVSAMEQLARDRELASRLGERGKERILRYSPGACAAGIANAVLCRRAAA